MHCPFCHHEDTRVIDSRVAEEGNQVRRRRECEKCGERFSTYESVELKLPYIVKQDGRREAFDEKKLRSGVELALHKRPIASETSEIIINTLMRKLRTSGEREVPSRRLGEWLMQELKAVDQVAFVRFASVYRRFEDMQDFREEIEKLERDLPVIDGKQMPLLIEETKPKK